MGQHSEAFVGIDTSKLKNAVAVAEAGRDGEVRYLGEFDTTEAATRKLIAKLEAKYDKLTFCYEAGPTGYGLHRLIVSLGHANIVAAPSLIPKKAGDHVKTNRRDAESLSRNLRAGALTAVWVPDERHEASCRRHAAHEGAISRGRGGRPSTTSRASVSRSRRCCCGSACTIQARQPGEKPIATGSPRSSSGNASSASYSRSCGLPNARHRSASIASRRRPAQRFPSGRCARS